MTELMSRPPRPRTSRPVRTGTRRPANRQPPTLAGAGAALRAAGLGLLTVMVLVLVAWATAADSEASASQAVGSGLAIWLVAHFGRVAVPGGSFGVAPLGLTLLFAALLFTSAARSVRDRHTIVSATGALVVSYAAVATVVALLARSAPVRPSPLSAFLGSAALAAVAGGAGAMHGGGRLPWLWHRLPVRLQVAVSGAAAAVSVVLGAGALLVAGTLLLHRGTVGALTDRLGAGWSGTLFVLLICVVYVPTAVLWGAAFLVGPGFSVGAGTSVAVTGVDLGAVPGLPLLGALPGSSAGGAGWWLLFLTMSAAGTAGGLVAHRGCRRQAGRFDSWRSLAEVAVLIGVMAGVALALLCAAASGPAGPGRLAETGPAWWLVGPVVAVETSVAAGAVLAVSRRYRQRA